MEQFLLGFIAGEGCFGISLYQRDSGKVLARPYFQLGVMETPVIEKAHNTIGVGSVSDRKNGFTEWRAQSEEDVIAMREWVEENRGDFFNASHKADQFDMWSKAVDIQQQSVVTDNDLKRLVDIAYDIPRSNTKSLSRSEWYQLIDDFEQYFCDATTEGGDNCQKPVPESDMQCHLHR